LNATSTANGIEVTDGAHARITGLKVVDLNSGGDIGAAIRCETIASGAATPSLVLDNVSVDSAYTAFFAFPCNLIATRSTFHVFPTGSGNIYNTPKGAGSALTLDRCVVDGGGIFAINGATIGVTNSLIENINSADGALVGESLFNSPTSGVVFASFVTLVNAPVICQNGTPACLGGADRGVCIDNSIAFATSGNAISGTACAVNYSLAVPQTATLNGAHNLSAVDPRFIDGANGNFALSASSPAIDAADPGASNPIDLLGTSRPQGPRDDMGAYEYKP
jgi:hypothetical protein